MQCLVCAGEARDLTPPNFDGQVIGCPSCGNYEILGATWDIFQNASQPERAAALGKAASLARRRPMADDQKHQLLIARRCAHGRHSPLEIPAISLRDT